MLRRNDEFIAKHKELLAKLYAQAEETRAKFNDDYNKKQMDEVVTATKRYENAFEEYVSLDKKRKESMQQMRVNARTALQEVEAIRAAQKEQLNEIIKNRETIWFRAIPGEA